MSHPALTQLRALRYFDQIPALDPQQLDWLLLEDSMTKRFEQQGKTVTVTLIQEGFVSGDEIASELPLLGKTPLGRYLFTSSELTRDFIEIGRDAELWGRRSRLRLSGKPLILTELFLPASPLY